MDRDTDRIAFESMDYLQRYGQTIRPELYDKLFEGEVDCGNLEGVFQMFNLGHPAGYRGRSLSVSDVVAVCDPNTGAERYYYWVQGDRVRRKQGQAAAGEHHPGCPGGAGKAGQDCRH